MNDQSDDKFFRELKKKTLIKTGPEFDTKFWAKFERRYPQPETRKKLFDFSVMIPASGLAAMLIVGILYFGNIGNQFNPQETKVAMNIMNMEVALDNMELMAEVDTVSMSDEEWRILLHDGV
jgi:hypothetical protein